MPASAFASAMGIQKPGGAPGVLARDVVNAACPSMIWFVLQLRGAKLAATTMGGTLIKASPHSWAAFLNTFIRWSPIVVPWLPPTGVAGVLSLKP